MSNILQGKEEYFTLIQKYSHYQPVGRMIEYNQIKGKGGERAVSEYVLELKGITKIFPGVKALNNVQFQLKPGEVHALMGENGAGKSTFIKVITGVHKAEEGEMFLNGQKVDFKGPKDAQEAGIAAVYQHPTSYPHLTVAENIFMGHEIIKHHMIQWKEMNQEANKYLKELVAAGGIDGMITVGEMSSTTLENCIGYTAEGNHELTMCFNFHHLKVDYKDGQKWELREPDYLAMKKLFQTWQEGMQAHGGWNALFWCNHDQPRAVSRFGSDTTYWKESAEMLAVAIHFMRGTPYIYQGEELGMTNPHFTKIEQYRDVESLNYYRILREQGKTEAETLDIIAQRSRDDSRTPMQWDASENAGFTTGTPWIGIADNYKAINAAAQMDAPDSIRSFYKTLVALRKKMPVISAGKIEFLYPDNADLLAYRRYDGETELLVLCNLREREIAKPLPVGWTDAEKLLGNYPDTADTLRPYECVVLKK